MDESIQLVVFSLYEQHYALYLNAVERIIRAVEVTPLPRAPGIVLGIINMRGQIIPVLNVCRRFGLPGRDIEPDDLFIIAHTSRRVVALVVHTVGIVVEYSKKQVTQTESIIPGLEYIEGLIKLKDGIILIHDLDTFLSLEEEKKLHHEMNKQRVEIHD